MIDKPRARDASETSEIALVASRHDFASPQDVLGRDDLSRRQKIRLLEEWAYDELERAVAEEENMQGEEPSILDEVIRALVAAGGRIDVQHSAPNKQHGI
jgi:hypothetical protein